MEVANRAGCGNDSALVEQEVLGDSLQPIALLRGRYVENIQRNRAVDSILRIGFKLQCGIVGVVAVLVVEISDAEAE